MAYTSIDDPSKHFQVTEYTGTGSTQSVVNTGNSNLKPDWVWIGGRASGDNNSIFDSSRGATKEKISNGTNAESTDAQLLTQFDTDGFTVGTNGGVNGSGDGYIAWQWKANGGTTSSNTDGYLTSTVQANTTAGFSIVLFTADGNTRTVGHGLGVKPDVVLISSRNAAGGWLLISDVWDGSLDYIRLDQEGYKSNISYDAPTSSVFQYNDNNGNTQVAYCFAEKQGYSKIGTYYGNQDADGPFVYTGFKPAFILVKSNSNYKYWYAYSNNRPGFNVTNLGMPVSTDEAESSSGIDIDILSNGFKLRAASTTVNTSGTIHFYMAFAENPFVTSTGTPTTAR
jgi:hypothetical protein